MEKLRKKSGGFTLVEILIVMSIIALLIIAVMISFKGQSARATDAKRKTDLDNLRKYFEDYNNDHNAFPDQVTFDGYVCGSGDMAPYFTQVPCDPATKIHYGYFPAVNGGYRICTKLSDTTDMAIIAMGCEGPAGCGLGGGYNYCLSGGVTASAVGTEDEIITLGTPTPPGNTPTPIGTPTPTLAPTNHIVCTSGGACNWYDDPAAHGCPISWETSCPPGACDIIQNRCAD